MFSLLLLLSLNARADISGDSQSLDSGSSYNAAADPCADLPVGQKRTVEIESGAKTTTLPSHYTVERTNDDTYKVHFNVRFQAGGNYAGPPGDVDAYYRNYVRKCLAQYNPLLVSLDDPKTKKKTHIELDIDADSPKDGGSAAPITIGGKKINPIGGHDEKTVASMNVYPSNIPCQTVVHELLHRTGLVDEYNQGLTTTKIASLSGDVRVPMPCRAPGPETSIMRNEFKALLPAGIGGYPLQPAHIKAIVYGGCQSRNATYYKCAQLAYNPSCTGLPDECSMDADWLRH